MHIGNAILCIADRGCLLLFVLQQISPPINLLVLKILLPDVFNFLAVLFSTAFFFEKEIMRALCAHDPIVSWVLSMLICSYVLQQISPPINLLVLKILLPDVFNFLAVLFSTAFFLKKR